MADFNTHVFSAVTLGGLGATLTTQLLGLAPGEGLALLASCTVGGVLPDIDLRDSRPSRLLFAVLGAAGGVAWLFRYIDHYAAMELWVGAAGIFLAARFPLQWLFHQFTVHRGMIHSLPAMALAALTWVLVCDVLLSQDAAISWLLGLALASGYLLHLVLDELYSVDFSGVRIKRSFGTAVKLFDRRRPLPAVFAVLAIVVLGLQVPSFNPLAERWQSREITRQDVFDALLPDYLTVR